MIHIAEMLTFLALSLGSMGPVQAETKCIHSWAEPGRYRIISNFEGQKQSMIANLSSGCRVTFTLPGVSTGGPVTKAGKCLNFSFRVHRVKKIFVALWCENYAIIPLQGQKIRVGVSRSVERSDHGSRR
jgi:hypothetical protein